MGGPRNAPTGLWLLASRVRKVYCVGWMPVCVCFCMFVEEGIRSWTVQVAWWLGVPRPSLGLRSDLRLHREWDRLQCRLVDGFHLVGVDVLPSGDGVQLRLDEQFKAGGPSVEAT